MEISEGIKIGLDSITSHKLRTMLTMLGIIFGVAAVISMLSIQEGAKKKVLQQIQSLGTKNIMIARKKLETEENKRFSQGLNLSDARAIHETCPELKYVCSVDTINFESIWSQKGEATAQVLGVTTEYSQVLNFHPQKGRFISDADLEEYRRVCVLGYQAKRDLFGLEPALDKSVRLGKHWFRVIGVMKPRYISGGSVSGVELQDFNQNIYIPLTSIYKHLRSPYALKSVSQIIVQVKNENQVWEAGSLINRILNRRHREVEDYQIIIPEALLQQSMEATKTFNIVMGAIAGISLLVGGIGIMNIMLASVLERTREIGTRRAIGATKMDIQLQFLIEAVLISLTGGIVGIIFGFFLGQGISRYSNLPTVTSWISVVISFVVASSIGIIFGFYPAKRAAQLNPIEALRYE